MTIDKTIQESKRPGFLKRAGMLLKATLRDTVDNYLECREGEYLGNLKYISWFKQHPVLWRNEYATRRKTWVFETGECDLGDGPYLESMEIQTRPEGRGVVVGKLNYYRRIESYLPDSMAPFDIAIEALTNYTLEDHFQGDIEVDVDISDHRHTVTINYLGAPLQSKVNDMRQFLNRAAREIDLRIKDFRGDRDNDEQPNLALSRGSNLDDSIPENVVYH